MYRHGMRSAREDALKAQMELLMRPDEQNAAPKPLREKKGPIETVDLKIFDEIAKAWGETGKPDFADMVKDGLAVVKAMKIEPGDKILVVSSSPSKWAEAAMMAQGAQLIIIEGQEYEAERVKDRLGYMFDGFQIDGMDKLKKVCKDNSSVDAANILMFPKDTKPFDHVCMACVLDAPLTDSTSLLLKSLELTKVGGNNVQGFATPAESTYTSRKVMETSKAAGYKLEEVECSKYYGDETRDGGIFKVVKKP